MGIKYRVALGSMVLIALVGTGCGAYLQHPDGWTEAEQAPGDALAVFYNPEPDFSEELPFTAKITIVAEPAPDLTLEEYVSSSKQLIPVLVPESELIGMSPSEIGGRPGYLVETTFQQGPVTLRSRQLCVAWDDKFYVITAMALDTHWDKYAGAFQQSLDSFRP